MDSSSKSNDKAKKRTYSGASFTDGMYDYEYGMCPHCYLEARWDHFPPNFGNPYCPRCKSSGVVGTIKRSSK